MNKDEHASKKASNLEKTLKALTVRREIPAFTIIFLILIFIGGSILTTAAGRSQELIMIEGKPLPVSTFAGVFSTLGNMCVIFMVVYYKKLGFITSMILLATQVPGFYINVFRNGNYTSIPGMFTGLLTVIACIIIFLNNRKIENYQKRINDQAVTDRLTGLPNRFAVSELIKKLIKQGRKFAVVTININNFKSINETMGMDTGNLVLIEATSRWKNLANSGETGTSDFISRVAGDEFSLVIRGYQSENELMRTIGFYASALEERITADDCDFYITASFGAAEYPTDADSYDILISCSVAAMTEIKRAKNSEHIARFRPEMLKIEHTLEIEREIRAALENDTIFFNLQPQYDMSHKLRGFETLARMKSADGKPISPSEFIPVAEKVGLIDKLDSTVFRKSAEFFGELVRKTGADITLSVNVSVRHLMKNGFLEELRDIIQMTGIPTNQLEIEITESIMIDSYEKALNCISEVKKMGIKIAIDDFGTGYSSLSYLHKFPADLLKVDKSFIDQMNQGESSKRYVASIISIGHIMGFDVISEGVEEPDQLETLRSIGCDYIQGFIWGRPLPKEEAEKLVEMKSA